MKKGFFRTVSMHPPCTYTNIHVAKAWLHNHKNACTTLPLKFGYYHKIWPWFHRHVHACFNYTDGTMYHIFRADVKTSVNLWAHSSAVTRAWWHVHIIFHENWTGIKKTATALVYCEKNPCRGCFIAPHWWNTICMHTTTYTCITYRYGNRLWMKQSLPGGSDWRSLSAFSESATQRVYK